MADSRTLTLQLFYFLYAIIFNILVADREKKNDLQNCTSLPSIWMKKAFSAATLTFVNTETKQILNCLHTKNPSTSSIKRKSFFST